jgi:imidazolonepropionase-like amidohydrolase
MRPALGSARNREEEPAMARIVFRGANLLDGEHPARPGTSVVVDGERIAQVAPDAAVATRPDDRIVALDGRTLLPGLSSCHFHGSFENATLDLFPLGMDQPAGVLMLRLAKNARLALQSGFTTLVGAGGGDDLDAQLVMAIEQGIVEGPRLLPCSRNLGTTSGYIDLEPWWYRMQNTGACRLADGADGFRQVVREEMKRGARMIKLFVTGGHGNLRKGTREFSREELAAVVETAHERGALVRAHAAWKPQILECVAAGVDVIDHGDEIDAQCIDAMAEAGTYFDPSVLYLEKLLAYAPLQGVAAFEPVRAATERELENLARWVPEAAKAGVRIVLGDDYGTVLMAHGTYAEEIESYVKRLGVPPLDVLRWATRNGAALSGRGDEIGLVEAGRLADLVVVDGDPSVDPSVLCDPRRILAVTKGGAFAKDALAG